MPEVPLPPSGSVPYIPPNREQAERRDALVLGAPPATAMSVGSPAADDALVAALEAAHSYISNTPVPVELEDERDQVLALTTAALDAILPGS